MCFSGFSLCHSFGVSTSSHQSGTSKKFSKSASETSQNLSKRRFEFSCVLEVLPRRVWSDFGLPNRLASKASRCPQGLQKQLLCTLISLEASSIDFGGYSDVSGLDFKPFLGGIFAPKFSPKRDCSGTVAEIAKH